jgi:uncharacterized protein
VKININQIPLEGLIIEEEITPAALDLETDTIKLHRPVKIKGEVLKITNAVTVKLALDTKLYMHCSRCLSEFEVDLKKNLQLGYPFDNLDQVIELGQDIREEIILDYPIKALCSPNCKGLCPKCGKNLNEGGCTCATT